MAGVQPRRGLCHVPEAKVQTTTGPRRDQGGARGRVRARRISVFSAARWRLTIVFTVVLVLILGLSGLAVYFTTRSLIYDQVDAELAAKAQSDLFLVDDEHGRGGPDDGR